MRVLGAVLAGGRSSRFGSDKAIAELDGKPLLAHAAEALAVYSDTVIVCGRTWPGCIGVPDRPTADLGPLGGVNAALFYAVTNGFDAVLSVGCDTPVLPEDLYVRLSASGAAAYLRDIPIIGLWPIRLAPLLDVHLTATEDRSLRNWARVAGAVAVDGDTSIANVNRPEDLVALRKA